MVLADMEHAKRDTQCGRDRDLGLREHAEAREMSTEAAFPHLRPGRKSTESKQEVALGTLGMRHPPLLWEGEKHLRRKQREILMSCSTVSHFGTEIFWEDQEHDPELQRGGRSPA